MANKEIWD